MIRPVVIAGGGLAGGAAACLLARAGCPVLLLEREATPATKICGEFISVEASMYLQHLGIDIVALGAHPIERVRLMRGRQVVQTKLPFAGFGLSRRILDEALLRHAAACGAEIRRGQTIRQVQTISQVKVGEGITLELGAAEDIHTSTLFLATGKHDLRGLRRQPQKAPEGLIGFKQHFRLSPAQQREMQGHVDVMLFPDGYAGLLLVEDGIANLCVLAGGGRLARTGGAWPALLQDLQQTAPHLHARLEGAVALEAKPVSISRVPYGFVHAVSSEDPLGVFRLGDQAGVIPSFTGDGMALALHSAVVATSAYLGGQDAAAYHFRIRRDIAGQIGRAAALYRMAHSAAGQKMLMQLAAVWPGSLALAATLTRISPRVLRRAVAQMPALGA